MSCRTAGNLLPWLCFWTCGLRQLLEKSALPLPTARDFPTVIDAPCTQQKAPGVAKQTSSSSSLSLKHRREIHTENTTGSLWGTSTHVLKPGYGEAGGERTPLPRAKKSFLFVTKTFLNLSPFYQKINILLCFTSDKGGITSPTQPSFCMYFRITDQIWHLLSSRPPVATSKLS